jgi:hypothetical protein
MSEAGDMKELGGIVLGAVERLCESNEKKMLHDEKLIATVMQAAKSLHDSEKESRLRGNEKEVAEIEVEEMNIENTIKKCFGTWCGVCPPANGAEHLEIDREKAVGCILHCKISPQCMIAVQLLLNDVRG